MRVAWLHDDSTPLPPAERAFPRGHDLEGLVAGGGELTTRRLREAYRNGIFPWYSQGQPVLWWSPDPRMVLLPSQLRITRSFRKVLRRFIATPGHEIRIDSAFAEVIESCARAERPGQDGTWILPEMVAAYRAWHAEGTVHSVETWIDGELLGGLYGVHLGQVFFGESMFARRSEASKIALAALVAWCLAHGVELIDCQQVTAHLASMGAAPIPRTEFLARVRHGSAVTLKGDWAYHPEHWSLLGITPLPMSSANLSAPVEDTAQ
jgi:leucyl/phenylalanyl-tRNA---protein transferase